MLPSPVQIEITKPAVRDGIQPGGNIVRINIAAKNSASAAFLNAVCRMKGTGGEFRVMRQSYPILGGATIA
jgi:C-terminal processing protease CtpA/Prc